MERRGQVEPHNSGSSHPPRLRCSCFDWAWSRHIPEEIKKEGNRREALGSSGIREVQVPFWAEPWWPGGSDCPEGADGFSEVEQGQEVGREAAPALGRGGWPRRVAQPQL